MRDSVLFRPQLLRAARRASMPHLPTAPPGHTPQLPVPGLSLCPNWLSITPVPALYMSGRRTRALTHSLWPCSHTGSRHRPRPHTGSRGPQTETRRNGPPGWAAPGGDRTRGRWKRRARPRAWTLAHQAGQEAVSGWHSRRAGGRGGQMDTWRAFQTGAAAGHRPDAEGVRTRCAPG